MEEFLQKYSLFGMPILVLIPFTVQGIKGAYRMAFNREMASWAQVLMVFLVAWLLLGAYALMRYVPDSSEAVGIALAGILGPLTAMGLYDGARSLVNKITRKPEPAPVVAVESADTVKTVTGDVDVAGAAGVTATRSGGTI